MASWQLPSFHVKAKIIIEVESPIAEKKTYSIQFTFFWTRRKISSSSKRKAGIKKAIPNASKPNAFNAYLPPVRK